MRRNWRDDHPGFPKTVLAYHTITDTWTELGEMTEALVTTSATRWNGRIVIASGEDRPGHRSPHVLALETRHRPSGFTKLDYVCLGAYLAMLIGMGVYFSRREKTTADYFLAGRRIPWWAAGISLFGTQLSAITFMAAPAKVYATDWAYFVNTFAFILITLSSSTSTCRSFAASISSAPMNIWSGASTSRPASTPAPLSSSSNSAVWRSFCSCRRWPSRLSPA